MNYSNDQCVELKRFMYLFEQELPPLYRCSNLTVGAANILCAHMQFRSARSGWIMECSVRWFMAIAICIAISRANLVVRGCEKQSNKQNLCQQMAFEQCNRAVYTIICTYQVV